MRMPLKARKPCLLSVVGIADGLDELDLLGIQSGETFSEADSSVSEMSTAKQIEAWGWSILCRFFSPLFGSFLICFAFLFVCLFLSLTIYSIPQTGLELMCNPGSPVAHDSLPASAFEFWGSSGHQLSCSAGTLQCALGYPSGAVWQRQENSC